MKEHMKKYMIALVAVMIAGINYSFAQKTDDLRMQRDIEVAENVLGTLIRQQFEQQRMFFPLEISGYYQPGYGVTFRLPADYITPMVALTVPRGSDAYIWDGSGRGYNVTVGGGEIRKTEPETDGQTAPPAKTYVLKDKEKENARTKQRLDMDSLKDASNQRIIEAAKNFIVDYGDLISSLAPGERIVVTNQGDRSGLWYFKNTKRTHVSIEGVKSDIVAYKQGKSTREQALAKLKIINTESSDKVEPDMELLSSIFSRLYRSDLSKTFFTDENIYYERLNDFGAVFYMQVYSSVPAAYQKFHMPTLGLEDIDQATREKKVKEMYPQFEQELKENVLEYGRTLKSLKDQESLIFNITLTKCAGCGIPSTLELSVVSTVLKDFSAGKIDKSSALSKMVIKKGTNQ